MSPVHRSTWIAALMIASATLPSQAQTLAQLADPAEVEKLADDFDVRNAENLPARGSKAALVSCIVYTNDRVGDGIVWVTKSGRSALAEAMCPHLVQSIYTQLPLDWMPDTTVFAFPDVKEKSNQDDTYSGYGDFGAVSADNGGGGNNVIGGMFRRGAKKTNRKLPANDVRMRKLTSAMGVDMTFVAAILVTPQDDDKWEVNSIELGGYGTKQPGASIRIGRGPWTQADVGIRLKKEIRFRWTRDSLDVGGFGNVTDALARKLLQAAEAR